MWDFDLIGPDGTVYPNWIEWREIVPSERIAYRQGGHENDPDAFETTVTFADRAGRTEITLRALLNSSLRVSRRAWQSGRPVAGPGLATVPRPPRGVANGAPDLLPNDR